MNGLHRIRQMLRPPGPVLDVHVHPLSDFELYRVTDIETDVQLLSTAADRAGITLMCLFSLGTGVPPEPNMDVLQEANDRVLRMRDLAPKRFLPFCYVSPMYPQESAREIERCVAEHGMVGVKLWIARRATDPGLDVICKKAIDLGVPLLQHSWLKTTGNLPGESTPEDVAHLAARFPSAKIIAAHLNGMNPRGLEALIACPNVLVDTSGGDPEAGMVGLAVSRLGSRRVIFGSDAPIRHFGVSLAKVIGENLSIQEKEDVLWNNAVRLFSWRVDIKSIAGAL